MEMDAVHGARRRFDAPAATLHDLASPLFSRTLRRHRGLDGERVTGPRASRPPLFKYSDGGHASLCPPYGSERPRSPALSLHSRNSAGVTGNRVIRTP